MRKKTLKLEVLGKEIEVVAPCVRVFKIANAKKDEMEQSIYLASACANMSEEEIEALDIADFTALQKVIADFLPKK